MKLDIEFLEAILSKASQEENLKNQFIIVPSQIQSIKAQTIKIIFINSNQYPSLLTDLNNIKVMIKNVYLYYQL